MSEPTPPPLAENAAPPEATGSVRSAGQSVDEGRGRIFPCEGCGADLLFNIGQQSLKCPYCGFEKQLVYDDSQPIIEQNYKQMLARLKTLHEEEPEADEEGKNEVRCNACGAIVVFVGTLTSSACPYCASPIQRDDVHKAPTRIAVDGVLPFLITEEKARANLKAWVASRWFAPSEFSRRGIQATFNGVYLPFFTFDSMTFTRYSGQRGDHYWVTTGSGKNRKRERRTRWSSASGNFQRFFDDVLTLATRGMNLQRVEALEPWPLNQLKPFNPEILAGLSARTYDITLEDGFTDAKGRIDDAIRSEVNRRIGGDEQRIDSIHSQYEAITFKHLLLPLWLLAYRFRDKPYQVMINATTGAVQGERPYSWVKITLAVIAGLIAAGAIALVMRS